MRGHFLAVFALLALMAACSGRTTRSSDEAPAGGGSTGVAAGGAAAGGAPAGSGAAPTGAGGEAVSDCACVAQEISWWREGGGVETRRENHIAPCNAFDYGEGPVGSAVMPQCSSSLERCGSSFGIDDLNAALRHPDVVDALVRAPQLFGADPRAIGGEVDHIEVGGKVIEIGYECEQRSECEIPQGIYAFGFLLGTLTVQQVGGGGCEIP